jgi:predicted aspartyl protease
MLTRRRMIAVAAGASLLPRSLLAAEAAGRVFTNSIALQDRRVWLAASIQGKGPFLFVVDTGAVVSLIQESVARELGLRARAPVVLRGVGGPESFLLYEAHDVVFSGGTRQPTAVFAAAGRHLALGPQAAGALAAGMLTAVDSELDFDRGELRVYPDGRGERSGFVELPSRIQHVNGAAASAYIIVDGVLDGRGYRFLLDTGMPRQVQLWSSATRKSGLWNDSTPFSPLRSSGIGGEADRGRLVRAGRLQIGGVAFERPLVGLSSPSALQRADFADGIIGLELLERLNLSTDVRRGRLWAQPNARPAWPERYGLTGLWVEERGGKVTVAEVSPKSPAADAGLRVGDEIAGIAMQAFVNQLAGQPGRRIPVTLRRGGETIPTAITLREFL